MSITLHAILLGTLREARLGVARRKAPVQDNKNNVGNFPGLALVLAMTGCHGDARPRVARCHTRSASKTVSMTDL